MNEATSSSSVGMLSSHVVILCGGLGTRLRDVLPDTPKPMADIAGRPFLQLLVDHVASYGFRRFVFCVGYKAGVIESFFRSAKTDYEIDFARESTPMGTAGALRNAGDLIRSDPFLVLNGDSFCGVDFRKMIEFHAARPAEATMAVVPISSAGEYGRVITDRTDRIVSFQEKDGQAGHAWVNGGVYVCRRRLLDTLGRQVPLSIEKEVFPSLAQAGTLFAYRAQGPLLDIGTPERYETARHHLLVVMEKSG